MQPRDDAEFRSRLAEAAQYKDGDKSLPLVELAKGIAGSKRLRLLQELLQMELDRWIARTGSLPYEGQVLEAHPALASDLVRVIDTLPNEKAPPPKKIGDFVDFSPIGHGGQGRVFSAMAEFSSQPVAIKLVAAEKPGVNHEDVYSGEAMLRREARALSQIRHDHIVRLFHAGKENHRAYLVMELLDCKLLDRHYTPHDAEKLASDLAKVAAGLQAAHAKGVYHHDLKPSNIMFDRKGEPRIIDFGFARETLDAKRAKFGKPVPPGGTYEYMAPEQAQGTVFHNAAVDVFGLGAVLYRVLTGKSLYQGNDAGKQSVACLWDKSALEQSPFPEGLKKICRRALAEKPNARFSSALEFGNALERFASAPARARRRKYVSIGAAGILLVMAILVMTSIAMLPKSWRTSPFSAGQNQISGLEKRAKELNVDLTKITAADFQFKPVFNQGPYVDAAGHLYVTVNPRLMGLTSHVLICLDGKTWDNLLVDVNGKYYVPIDGRDFDYGFYWACLIEFPSDTTKGYKVGPFSYQGVGWSEFHKQTGIEFESASNAEWAVAKDWGWQLTDVFRKQWPIIVSLEIGDSETSLPHKIHFHKETTGKIYPSMMIPPVTQDRIDSEFSKIVEELEYPAELYIRLTGVNGEVSKPQAYSRRQQLEAAYANAAMLGADLQRKWRLSPRNVPYLHEVQEIRIGATKDNLSKRVEIAAHVPKPKTRILRNMQMPGYYGPNFQLSPIDEPVPGRSSIPAVVEQDFDKAIKELGDPDELFWQIRFAGSVHSEVRSIAKQPPGSP